MKTTTIRKIALSQLEIAPENARKSQPSVEVDASLLASISAHGLKQNLGVYAGENDTFFVHAGGRRLRALRALAEAGVIEADYKVPCIVEDAGDASEISLVENIMRVAMHPADEYDAFAALIDQGSSEEEVAGRFGCTVLHVRKRLKLARVAPEIIAKYRDDTITLETLMAFTLTDSHDRQREVWTMIEPSLRFGGSPAHQVKQLLNETRIAGNTRLARLVGVERYEAAGGTVTRDLFSSKESIFFNDPGLLEQLAIAVLEEAAEELRGDWKWVEVMLDMPWNAAQAFGRVYPQPVDADPAAATELEAASARLDGLADLENPTEEEAAEHDRLLARAEELEEAIGNVEQAYTDEAKAIAGCILTVDHQGELKVEAGLVRPEDIPVPEPVAETADADENAETGTETDEQPEPAKALRIDAPRMSGSVGSLHGATALDPAAAKRKEIGLSAALADDLRAIRHQILQAHLAGDFETAFDLHLYSLCQSIFVTGYRSKPIDLAVTPAHVGGSADHLKGTVAQRMLEAQKKNLRLDWLKLKAPEDFQAMSALKSHDKQALFAWATSHGLVQQISLDHGASPVIEQAGRRMEVDVAACWRPTAANYFTRIRKDQSIEVARELIDERWADEHGGDKKAILAEAMEAAFSENARQRAGLAPEYAAKTARWLPAGMAFIAEGADASDLRIPDGTSADEIEVSGETDAESQTSADEGDITDDEDDVAIPAFLIEQAA